MLWEQSKDHIDCCTVDAVGPVEGTTTSTCPNSEPDTVAESLFGAVDDVGPVGGPTTSTAVRIGPATVSCPLFGAINVVGPSTAPTTSPTTSTAPNSEPDSVADRYSEQSMLWDRSKVSQHKSDQPL